MDDPGIVKLTPPDGWSITTKTASDRQQSFLEWLIERAALKTVYTRTGCGMNNYFIVSCRSLRRKYVIADERLAADNCTRHPLISEYHILIASNRRFLERTVADINGEFVIYDGTDFYYGAGGGGAEARDHE